MFKKIIDKTRAERVFDDALQILNEIGVECADGGVVEKIAKKAPLTYKNNRIYFEKKDLARHFESRKPDLTVREIPEKFSIGGQWHAWYLVDPVTNRPRLASHDEAVKCAKFAESFGKKGGPIPVAPGGINPRAHTIECEKIALIHTKKLGTGLTVSGDAEIDALAAMFEAAGRRYTLAVEPMISPLKFNAENLSLYLRQADNKKIDIVEYGAMPSAGATAPLAMPAGLSLAFAETLALDYIFYNYSDGRHHGGFGVRLDHIDFKSLNMVFGSPERAILRRAIIELWRELTGGETIVAPLHSNSKCVDAQAVMEKTTAMMYFINCGARVFGAVGQLSVDEVYSPVMAVIDREIVKTGGRLMRSLDGLWDDSADTVKIVLGGLNDRNYIGADSTVDIYKKFFGLDVLSSYENCAAWAAGGFKGIEERARAEYETIAAAHDFRLQDDGEREVNKIAEGFMKGIN